MIDSFKGELKLIFSTKLQTENGKRAVFLDMARGIAIFLVVMGHRGFITNHTNTWLSSFHLPLFFIASGLLLELKSERESKLIAFIIRKIKSLLVPYFAFSFIAMGLDFYFVPFGKENLIPDFKTHLIETFTFQGYSVMWFLPVTFLAEIIFILIYKGTNRIIASIIFTILSAASYYGYGFLHASMGDVLWVSLVRILVKAVIAATFISYGVILEKYLMKKKKFSLVGLIVAVFLIAINVAVSDIICLKDLNNIDLGYITVYFLLGVSGSVGIFLLCKNCINIPFITYFGRNSLLILCTHLNCYVLYYGTIFYMHFYKHYHLPDIVNENVTANIYTMIFTFMLEIPVIVVVNVLFPFLVGRGYKIGKSEKTK